MPDRGLFRDAQRGNKREFRMDHVTCDLCGRLLLTESDARYEVTIDVKGAYDTMEVSQTDLNRNFREEIAKILRRLEGLSAEEALNQVCRRFEFDLCSSCQVRYTQKPLGDS